MDVQELRDKLAEYDDDTPVINRGSSTEKAVRVESGKFATAVDGEVEKEDIVVIA